MITQNQIGTLDFSKNALLNGLNKPDRYQTVWDLSGGYNVIDYIVSKNKQSRATHGNEGYFEKPIMGNPVVIAQVASTSASGANLVVTFTDPTYDSFRLQEVVGDCTANMNQGRVVNKGAGFIEIEPAGNTISGGLTGTFAAGSYALMLYTSSPLRGSNPMESRYNVPTFIGNRTSVMRENVELYAADMFQTWVAGQMKIDEETGVWASVQDQMMAKQIAVSTELRALWSQYGQYTSGLGGKVNYSMGLKDSIQDPDRNGTYRSWTNVPTEGQFQDFIGTVADKQNKPKTTFKFICGRGMLQTIQGFNSPMIVNTGTRNTLGGEKVVGLDSYLYSIGGYMVDIIHHPLFNDMDRFPTISTISGTNGKRRMQYTGILLDESDYQAVGQSVMLPAMEKVYYPTRGQEEVYYYTPGIIGTDLQGANMIPSSAVQAGSVYLAVTQKDAVTFGYYSNFCFDFMTQRMGWCELAS